MSVSCFDRPLGVLSPISHFWTPDMRVFSAAAKIV
jgi:hypothetical protein